MFHCETAEELAARRRLNHSDTAPGNGIPIGVVGSQPPSCISWTLSPTMTSSTKPSKIPVATSIFR